MKILRLIPIVFFAVSCSEEPISGEADMLHGCFNDQFISELNKAVNDIDILMEECYSRKNAAENYQTFIDSISNRNLNTSPVHNIKLRRIVERMQDSRVFYELFTMYQLDYESHSEAARTGLFDLYMLDPDKPFFKCWIQKVEHPIIKAHLENYAKNEAINPMDNLWFEVDRMSTLFDSEDFENPETRLYVAVFNVLHLAYMNNPKLMMDGVDTNLEVR